MNRVRIIAFVALAPIFAASAVLAQSQSAMNATAAQNLRRADQALNAQYTATTGQLSTPSRTLLRDAQRAWITFRDQQCRYESSAVRGGSAFAMVQSDCLARLTVERTRELRRLAQCEEGDLSCPR